MRRWAEGFLGRLGLGLRTPSPPYFSNVRADIAPLLPLQAHRIVDVGCGTGATLSWLRELYPEAYTIGVEGNADLRQELSQNADEVHIVDLAAEAPNFGEPDLMLFLDILEHLPAPADALKRLSAGLAPGGTIIVSLPNVAHLSVAVPLLFQGEFTYRDAGILDRTHLRFFVQKSAVQLLEEAGFSVTNALMTGLAGPRARMLDALTLHLMRTRLSKQFVMQGVRGQPPGAIRWEVAR
jgi:2-polyprenyl-3-methyl-5-hydroxy-6-metoxy-1,4-benzoquinol methylase